MASPDIVSIGIVGAVSTNAALNLATASPGFFGWLAEKIWRSIYDDETWWRDQDPEVFGMLVELASEIVRLRWHYRDGSVTENKHYVACSGEWVEVYEGVYFESVSYPGSVTTDGIRLRYRDRLYVAYKLEAEALTNELRNRNSGSAETSFAVSSSENFARYQPYVHTVSKLRGPVDIPPPYPMPPTNSQ